MADGVGVDVSVSEWSLQADPGRSRNASAMLLSSFFTIECYDSMRQRNQIYLERWTGGWTACKFQAGYAFNTPSNGWICLSEKERSRRRVCNYLPTVVNEPPQRSSIHRRERPYSILTGLFPYEDKLAKRILTCPQGKFTACAYHVNNFADFFLAIAGVMRQFNPEGETKSKN